MSVPASVRHRVGAVPLRSGGQPVPASLLMGQAAALARRLPDRASVVNLCEDRHRFLAGLLAAMQRDLLTVLPPSRLPSALDDLAADLGPTVLLDDRPGRLAGATALVPETDLRPPGGDHAALPTIADDRVVLRIYTSGSTGKPTASPKRWGRLRAGSEALTGALGLDQGPTRHIVATVPPQHMYGFETTVLLPLLAGASVHAGRPFFPQDIADALSAMPAPRLLVSTPVHLRACLDQPIDWPALEGIVCSTSPLDRETAGRIERCFGCPVREIYGSTETGAVALRRTTEQPLWTLLPGMRLRHAGELMLLTGPQLDGPLALADRLRLHDGGRFELLGRASDLVKVAGKRASLTDLNLKLNSIEGVEDGVVLAPDGREGARLVAVVVAPGLGADAIRRALRDHVDPVFLPRRIVRVDALPRNAAGKLPREAIEALIGAAAGADR